MTSMHDRYRAAAQRELALSDGRELRPPAPEPKPIDPAPGQLAKLRNRIKGLEAKAAQADKNGMTALADRWREQAATLKEETK